MPSAAQPSFPVEEIEAVMTSEAAASKAQASRAGARAARRHAALDAQKRAFLRMVSHELRTPLNAIIGFSEIMAAEFYGPLGAPQYKDYAEHVRQSGHRLLRLVNQVMEIARLEGHALDVDPRPESLGTALEDVVATLRDEIAAAGATVSVKAPANLPNVLADPRGLRTLLVNLVQNAVVHGGGHVVVRVRTPKAGSVEIAVEDKGPGCAPEDLPRLLRPFEQGGQTLTRAAEGAGLGLSIARLLTEAMGGELRLRSDRGAGFTASVSLPTA